MPDFLVQKVVLPSVDGDTFSVRESARKVRYVIGYGGQKHPAVSAHHASDIIQRLGPENTRFSPWDCYNFFSHKGQGQPKCAERLPAGLTLSKVEPTKNKLDATVKDDNNAD